MLHPLYPLDSKRKYLCSLERGDNSQHLYLCVITNKESMAARPDVSEKLALVMNEAQRDFARSLALGKKRVLAEKPLLDKDEVNRKFPEIFGNPDSNHTVFIVEDEDKNLVCAIHLTINDWEKRRGFGVSAEIGTFIYIDDIITSEQYKGSGVLSVAFDKIITSFSKQEFDDNHLRKQALKLPLEFAVSMMVVDVCEEENADISKHIVNLEIFSAMWRERFDGDLRLRIGWSDSAAHIVDFEQVADLSDEIAIKKSLSEIERRGLALPSGEMSAKNILAIHDGIESCLSAVCDRTHSDLMAARIKRFAKRNSMSYQLKKHLWHN